MSISDSEMTPELSPLVSTPGGLLKEGRERAGFTLEYVAKELHMSLSKVKALETDDYTNLNANTFIRGYLRAYANLLKLDSAIIIASYEQQTRALGAASESQHLIAKDSSPKKLWGFVLALILLMASLWLISVWFFDNQVERPIVTPPMVVAQPAASLSTAQQANTSAEIASQGAAASTDDKPLATTEVDSGAQQVAALGNDQSATPVVAATEKVLDKILFNFTEECWLEVSDAQGDVLATELQRPGTSVSLFGVAPFNVKLGNAPAARVTLNGVDVQIDPPAGTKVMMISVGE